LVVGAVGFFVDTALLSGLTGLAHWSPWHARIVSTGCAVLATWLLNRNFTFAGRGLRHWPLELLLYVAGQAFGLAINLGVFGLLLPLSPRPGGVPIFAQIGASAAALIANFAVANYLVYARARAARPRMPSASHPEYRDRLG
jgi:putative flippase GtrA